MCGKTARTEDRGGIDDDAEDEVCVLLRYREKDVVPRCVLIVGPAPAWH
jgi:hypothetical protein